MKIKKKIIIISTAFFLCAAVFLCLWGLYMSTKAFELTKDVYDGRWQTSLEYPMLSDKLKKVISEEEFNNLTDSGKYNIYRKLEGLELEANDKYDSSTDEWKTAPFDIIETDKGKFLVEYRIDFKVHLTRIEVINFVTYIYPYN